MSPGKLPSQQASTAGHEWLTASLVGAAKREPRSARVNYLRPGSIVVHSLSSGSATDSVLVATAIATEVDIEVAGRISRIDARNSRLIVDGQTAQLDALSYAFQIAVDGRRIAVPVRDLAAGDRVEIAGPRNSQGDILATRIERLNRPRPPAADDCPR